MIVHVYKLNEDTPIIYNNAVDLIIDEKDISNAKLKIIIENNSIIEYSFQELNFFIQSPKTE